MNLYYNGVDITDRVSIIAASVSDVSSGCCDHAELEFENAAQWISWKPQMDDVIELVSGNYSGGQMCISAVYPNENKYRIMATAIPSMARRKLCVSYNNMTLGGIAQACAAESGMSHKLYGITDQRYDYMVRSREGCAAFLERLARMEGAVLKCWNGRYTLIGIETAQNLDAGLTIEQNDALTGFRYTNNAHMRVRKLTVISPYAKYTAEDTGADGSEEMIVDGLPAVNDAQAARWARGLLLANNRKAETLTVSGTFNAGMTAMVRINVTGENDIAGEWIIDSVEHDLFNGSSTATLMRCIDTVI